MRFRAGLVLALAILTGCGGGTNDEIVGKWTASDTYGGGTWQFKSDGTFAVEGGQHKSLDGSGKMVPNMMRSGKWAEKNGNFTLNYESPAELKTAEYKWKKNGTTLELSRAGSSAPEMVLQRAN